MPRPTMRVHDQGQVPVKLLSYTKSVNVTLGLPFVRTSPCHGTGFDIAIAAIALKNRRLLPSPSVETDYRFNIITKEVILNKNNTIGCLESGDIDEYNYYELS